ncbi:hypothetical protein DY000_02015348 [Brassica cretica]|uniref:Uncharacterized protein n=1 Tax=Brassica cretica TaxID=69181 RepID=A0ABQ7D472_BRACR|nr:hypothetical protein DY000_02015348 [Brassica cretica]
MGDNLHSPDVVMWRKNETEYCKYFFTAETWQRIRVHGTLKEWSKVVWLQLGVPRFAFITGLAIKNKLSTGELVGTLLGRPPDPDWESTLGLLTTHRYGHLEYLLVRLVLQASIFVIWRERNDQTHLKKPKQPSQLARIVDKTVKNKNTSTGYAKKEATSERSNASLVPSSYIVHSSILLQN